MRRVGSALTLVLVAGAFTAAAPGGTSTSAARYEDERSEEVGAPDIATVSVSNDDDGEITFFVSIPSHPDLTPDMRIRIWFSDGDPATGLEAGGFDHFVLVDGLLLGVGNAGVYDCAGSVCAPTSPVGLAYERGASFTIPAEALGLPTERWGSTPVEFYVVVGDGWAFVPGQGFDATNVQVDYAPSAEGPNWRYLYRIGPSRLLAGDVETNPRGVRAGERIAARVRVVRDDTRAAIGSGVVTCSARVGPRRLPSRPGRFVDRQAECTFAVPPGTSGRSLRGSIAVSRGELKAERSFVREIR